MNSPPSACRTVGCAGLVDTGSLCKECSKLPVEVAKDYHQQWKFMYADIRWKHPKRGLRIVTLKKDPVCVACKRAPSTVADHIIDHRGDWNLFLDQKNLQGMCQPCHHEKTGREHGKKRNGGGSKPSLMDDGTIRDYPLE